MGVKVSVALRGGKRARIGLRAAVTPCSTLVFEPPLEIKGLAGGGMVFLEARNLAMMGIGRTVQGALRDLCTGLVWLWWEYAEAREDELSEDARVLARRLRSMGRWIEDQGRGWVASAVG